MERGLVLNASGRGSDEKVTIKFHDGTKKKFLVKFAPLSKNLGIIMKKACIDIGSNSIVLLVGEVKDGKIVELEHQSEVTRLGFKVTETKQFNEERMSESEKVINRFLASIEKHDVDKDNVFKDGH